MQKFEHIDDLCESIDAMLSATNDMGDHGYVELQLLEEGVALKLESVVSGGESVCLKAHSTENESDEMEIYLTGDHLYSMVESLCSITDMPRIKGLNEDGEQILIRVFIKELDELAPF